LTKLANGANVRWVAFKPHWVFKPTRSPRYILLTTLPLGRSTPRRRYTNSVALTRPQGFPKRNQVEYPDRSEEQRTQEPRASRRDAFDLNQCTEHHRVCSEITDPLVFPQLSQEKEKPHTAGRSPFSEAKGKRLDSPLHGPCPRLSRDNPRHKLPTHPHATGGGSPLGTTAERQGLG